MSKKLLCLVLALVMCAALFVGCDTAGTSSNEPAATSADTGVTDTPTPDTYKIYLITMDQMDQHWVSVDEGCQAAVAELGNVEYKWTAPDTKDDAQQIERINNAVADGANAILLAANGPEAVNEALTAAAAANVKIIYVDSPASFAGEATFATNNEAAGKTAGDEMIKALAAANITSGKIGIINVNTSTQSCVDRENGFRSAFDGNADFELLTTQYGEGKADTSKTIADNYITDGAVGIFGCNEGSTVGAGNAIKEATGKTVIGVGFDKSDSIIELLKDGSLIASMSQDPYKMGYEGMKAAAAVLAGETLAETSVDTGVQVLTKDTV